MRISDVGEFGLIQLVQKWTRQSASEADAIPSNVYRTVVDNGDDGAAVTFMEDRVTEFYTTDTMVDGIHFTSKTTPWRDLGWKAIASNVSDVAAMGGTPAPRFGHAGVAGRYAGGDIEEPCTRNDRDIAENSERWHPSAATWSVLRWVFGRR